MMRPCAPSSSTPGPGIELNGRLLFGADDGRNGRELWMSDGTAPGTRLLRDIDPRRLPGAPPGSCDDNRDETGLGSDPRDFVRYKNGVLFTAADGKGRELWRTDGTPQGTQLVKTLARGGLPSWARSLTAVDGLLVFAADDGVHGRELWAIPAEDLGVQP